MTSDIQYTPGWKLTDYKSTTVKMDYVIFDGTNTVEIMKFASVISASFTDGSYDRIVFNTYGRNYVVNKGDALARVNNVLIVFTPQELKSRVVEQGPSQLRLPLLQTWYTDGNLKYMRSLLDGDNMVVIKQRLSLCLDHIEHLQGILEELRNG